ncbi:MAG: 2-oxo acid dehydrogenase subunit E2 [Acidobacteria bacterium]|nr:2-oxo acid dehydrogenase subunit E2 [Acidobacteriota bacterium]
MAVSVVMPALEMAQETGKLVAWLKKEGEPVRKGEMLLEVETDKAVVEVEAAGDGILAGVTARPGDVIAVGHTIAWLVAPGEAPPAAAPADAPTARRTDAAPQPAAVARADAGTPAAQAPRISPKARRLAGEHGVDLSRLTGSGPGGEILADDILAAAERLRLKPATTTEQAGSDSSVASGFSRTGASAAEAPTTIGRLMAERTTESWTTVPHFFVTRDVDATALTASREALLPEVERSHGVKLTHTDLIVAAVARALRRHPRLNASWTGNGIVAHADVNIALALAVENAVVTGVIARADTLAIGDLAARRRELAERARAGRLQPGDVAGATFTLSNLGMFDVDAFTAIIVPPQAAILAVGAIADRVVAVNGAPAVRPMVSLTLSCDHRVADGARAAEFLRDVVTELTRT